MSKHSRHREANLRRPDQAAIHLADILSSHHAYSEANDGNGISPDYAEMVFAKGRYRSQAVRPFMRCFDCDVELVSSLSIKCHHPPSLCIGLLLKGAWRSIVNGKAVEMPGDGTPGLLAAGKTFEVETSLVHA